MKKYIAIVGPTASCKTAISIELAKALDAEIISADSRQIYKNIPISTATPTLDEMQDIKHYFLEEIELDREYNACDFGKDARIKIEEIFRKGKFPLVVGGSGLYIKSLIDGFFDEEMESKEIRKELYDELEKFGKEYLYQKLKNVDEESASKMSPHFYRRVIRALEVYYATGNKMSDLQKQNVKTDYETVQFGLMLDRKYLYDRINKRVDKMIEAGLIKEIEWLKNNGYHYKTNNSLNTVGIKEVFKYFEGEYTYAEMVNYIKQNSRRYAKRQMTWFRKDLRIIWIDGHNQTDIIVKEIIKKFEEVKSRK
ncbi:MAG: tRNA (adenosine(37)-N6)-dimethylallyltransferase MiaA [Ignavibacteriae bacterium]|nr:tRNA (adenosine(37)-N6)-dimethylallyltransferase MiaA [Ignavibacteriota bacterium]